MERAKAETTPTQFYQWVGVFEEEAKRVEKQDLLLARIGYEIHVLPFRVWGKDSKMKFEEYYPPAQGLETPDRKKKRPKRHKRVVPVGQRPEVVRAVLLAALGPAAVEDAGGPGTDRPAP